MKLLHFYVRIVAGDGQMFEQISNDPYILDIYEDIKSNIDPNGHAIHSLDHIHNVVSLVEKFLKLLEFDESTIERAKIAAFLHDIGMKYGKENHAQKSYEIAREYFVDKMINTGNNDEVLTAIKHHSEGLEDDIVTSALMLADKLDVKYSRVTNLGKRVHGIRQYYYIHNVVVMINSTSLKIMFLVDEKANKKELEDYYFTAKIFRAVNQFAKVINRLPVVYYNDEIWTL